MSDGDAREAVYGMPYSEWKDQHQTPATPEQKARDAGIAARFWGRISDQELFDRYREASVFAMPSTQETPGC